MAMTRAIDKGEAYGVVIRLMQLRDLLRTGPRDFRAVAEELPGTYDDGEAGKRRFRRDVHNLGALGYAVERTGRPARWLISGGPSFVSDEDVEAMAHVRDAFATGHPQAPAVQRWLQKLSGQLSDGQAKRWRRRPALRVPLRPAIDYTASSSLIEWLETAIDKQQQIAFLYRAPTSATLVPHRRLDPYEIEYTDRHFYLLAFDYDRGTTLTFRVDRIVQDRAERSPELLRSHQQPRHEPKPIHFTYRLPAALADSGVSERFTIHAVHKDEQYVIIEASDPSEFKIVRVLLGYGESALLLDGPPSLVQRMREKVALMSRQYGLLPTGSTQVDEEQRNDI